MAKAPSIPIPMPSVSKLLMLSVHPLFGLSKGFFRGTQSLKRDRAPSLLLW